MSRKDHDMTLIIEDVMGETPLDNPKLKAIVEKINSMTGWAAIKNSVTEMLKVCEMNYKLELLGKIVNTFMLTLESYRFPMFGKVSFCIRTFPNR